MSGPSNIYEQAKEQIEQEAIAERPVDTAKCSQCGSEHLDVLEEILAVRSVRGINAYGEYVVNSHYDVYDEAAENTRIVCRNCGHTVEVPPDVEDSIIRYVF